MPCKRVVAITAALVATALCVPSADARARKKAPANQQVAPSLDGRITGRARTCWHETFVYDGKGVPVGPYCH